MSGRLAVWFPIGLVFLLALLTFWLDRMVQPATSKKEGNGRHDPDYWVENFTATHMGSDGTPSYVLAAGKMTHYPDDDTTDLTLPNLTHYVLGQPTTRIQAQTGKVSSDGEHAWFTFDVKVTREAAPGQSELIVTTDYLHLIPGKNFAQTDREITLRDATATVTAVGMELDNNERTIKFLSRVKGHYANPSKATDNQQ